MKKNGHRLLTLAALVGTAAGVIHIANRFIDATSQLKDMLEQPHGKTYDWRFGKIFYTKQGHGTPILLIHDIMPGASGYEWNAIEKQLATEHTVYTIDLLGCGRSEKPDITYTNFVFAQLLCDFAKNVIREETDVIASASDFRNSDLSYGSFPRIHQQSVYGKAVLQSLPCNKYTGRHLL